MRLVALQNKAAQYRALRRLRGTSTGSLVAARLSVVLLSIDACTHAIRFSLQAGAFPGRDIAIGFRASFVSTQPGFASNQSAGFRPGQLAASYTLVNARGLVVFASVKTWRTSKRGRAERRNNKAGNGQNRGSLKHVSLQLRKEPQDCGC